MASVRRNFTDDQKLEILNLAQKIGVSAVLRNHSLSYSVFSRWKQKFMQTDNDMQQIHSTSKIRLELRQLNEDNIRLKKIIADQALQLERKNEELKKSKPHIVKK